jgi:hypothetical protein
MSETSALILSTLPHFAAAVPLILSGTESAYLATIMASSTLSVFWHLNKEPRGYLFYLDYGLAAVWTAADLYYAFNLWAPSILLLNVLVLFANVWVDVASCAGGFDRHTYSRLHSTWHFMSAAKAIYVACVVAAWSVEGYN